MKLLLAFSIAINSYVIANEFQTGPLANQEEFTILRRGLRPFKVFSSSSSDERFRRNPPGDQLKDFIEKSQTISRLINVIYLQQGISDGSVFKTDELISELLHFGPVKLEDIQAIDIDKIKKAFDSVKELPSKLKMNDVTQLEDAFSIIGNLQKNISGLSELKWDGKDAFAADLEKIKQGKVDFSLVANLETQLTNWKSSYGQVTKMISKSSFIQTDMAFVSLLGSASSELKDMIEKLQKKTSFFEFANGEKAIDAINPLIRILSSVEILKKENLATSDNWFDSFDKNAKEIAEAAKQMKDVRTNLDVVKNIFFYQLYPHLYTSTEYTHGLPDGYNDVGKITKAFNDAWLKDIVQNGSLDKSYPSVQSLASYITPIQKHLEAPKKALESLSNVMKESKSLDIFDGLSKEKVRSVSDCFKNSKRNSPSPLVGELKSSAENIDKELGSLATLLKEATQILKGEENNLGSLIELLSKTKQDDASTLGPTIQSFGTFHASSRISAELARIIPANINDVKLKQFATTAATKLGDVVDYEKKAADYYGYLNCLLKKEEAPKVIDAVKNSGDLRKSSTATKYNEGLQAVQSVVNTKTGLSDLQNTITKAKGKTTLESGLLNLLENANFHSEILGSATRGAANMKALIDRKSEFAVFEAQSKLVKSEAKKHSNKFSADESKLLKELVALEGSIETMYTGLTNWTNGIPGMDLTVLESFPALFKNIKDAKELPEDLSKMTQVLQKLIESVEAEDPKSPSIKPLRAVEAALITLDGLHFSNYVANSGNVTESVNDLKSFFIEYAKAEVIKRSATPSPQIVFVPQAGANIAEVEEKENATDQLILIIVSACAVIGIIVTAVIIIVCCCCKKIDDDDIDGPVEDADPPLEVRVWFMRKYGTQVAKYAENRQEEIRKLLPGLEKKLGNVNESEMAGQKTSIDKIDRKAASGDEETDKTSTSFLEGVGNEPEMFVEVSELSDSDDDDQVQNMAGGNREVENSSEGVNPEVSESSEDEEVREMAGGIKEEVNDNLDPEFVDVEASELSDETAREIADQEFRLRAGGNKKKNNASVNLTITKNAVKTPAKSKEPATPQAPADPKASADPKAPVDPKASADPKTPADPKPSVDKIASTGKPATSNESTNSKLPDKVNAPSKAPEVVDKVERMDLEYPEPDPMPAPIGIPQAKEEDPIDDEFANKKPAKDDQLAKSDPILAAEVKIFSEFQYFMVEKDMKECNKPEDANEIVQKHKKEVRERVWLNEDNRVKVPTILTKKKGTKFMNDFFHGNVAKFRNGRKIIACQGPKVKAEDGKVPTVDKFYYVAKVNNVRAILMLCNFEEPVEKEDGTVEMKTKCDEYFPLEEKAIMSFTGFTVTCTKKTVAKDLITRELTIAYDGEEPYQLTHYHYLGWPDKSTPSDSFQYAEIWKTLRKLNATIMIHCSAGIGRTGTALLIEELYQHIHYSNGTATGTGLVDFGAALRNVRKYRARAVQSSTQFTFAIMVVLELCFAWTTRQGERISPPPVPEEGMERVSVLDFQLFQKYKKVWMLLRPDPPPVFKETKGGDKKSTTKTEDGEKSKEKKVDGKKSVVKTADGQKSKETTVDTKKSTAKEPTTGKKK